MDKEIDGERLKDRRAARRIATKRDVKALARARDRERKRGGGERKGAGEHQTEKDRERESG